VTTRRGRPKPLEKGIKSPEDLFGKADLVEVGWGEQTGKEREAHADDGFGGRK